MKYAQPKCQQWFGKSSCFLKGQALLLLEAFTLCYLTLWGPCSQFFIAPLANIIDIPLLLRFPGFITTRTRHAKQSHCIKSFKPYCIDWYAKYEVPCSKHFVSQSWLDVLLMHCPTYWENGTWRCFKVAFAIAYQSAQASQPFSRRENTLNALSSQSDFYFNTRLKIWLPIAFGPDTSCSLWVKPPFRVKSRHWVLPLIDNTTLNRVDRKNCL